MHLEVKMPPVILNRQKYFEGINRTSKWSWRGVLTFGEFFDGYDYGHNLNRLWGGRVDHRIRTMTIAAYLLVGVVEAVDLRFPEAGTAPRIEGELRRFGLRYERMKTPMDVKVDEALVERFCKYEVIEVLTEPIRVAVGLLKPEDSKLGKLAHQLV